MKINKITLAILFLFPSVLMAEEITSNGFIFPDYETGKVYFKSNEVIEALFNYNTLSEQVYFKKNNEEVLVLGYPGATDSVVMAGRVFVHYQNDIFLEKVKVGKGLVYIRHQSTMVSAGKGVGYGGYSQLTSAKSLSNFNSSDGLKSTLHLDINEKFKVNTDNRFMILKEGGYIEVGSRKQVLKAFPENKEKIQTYLTQNKTDFSKPGDLMNLLSYCFSLK